MRNLFVIVCFVIFNISIYSQSNESLLKHAEELYADGNYYESCAQLDEIIKENHENIRALQDRSAVLFAMGNYQNALIDINSVIILAPNSLKARHFRATIYEAMCMFDEALIDELFVLEKVPDYLPGLNLAGYINLELKNYDVALDYFNKLIFNAEKTNKKSDIYFLNRAYLFYNLKKFDSSIADITQALTINYKNVDALVLKTFVYREKQDFKNAIDTINSAINLNPMETELFYIRIIINLEWNKILDVERDLKMLEKRGVNSAEYHALSSAYYTIQGNIAAAEAEINQYKVLEREIKNPLLIKIFDEKQFFE